MIKKNCRHYILNKYKNISLVKNSDHCITGSELKILLFLPGFF